MRQIIVIALTGGVIGVASWFVARPHVRVGVLNTLGMQTSAPKVPAKSRWG